MRTTIIPLAILLSTTVCGGIFTASPAAAAEAIRPQGNWAVSKVAAKQTGAVPYCALARRFANGSILTFARNGFDETSVAVDVPKGGFTTGQDVTVTFSAGPGQARSYQTQPVSERGVVVRMGRDDSFYAALEDSGQLDVTIGGQAYAFAVTDLKSGTEDLGACLGAVVEPAAGGSVAGTVKADAAKTGGASALTPIPATSTATATASPVEDRGAAQSLQEENIRLRNALERERRVYEEKMQQGENGSAAAELGEKLRLLEIENRELKAQSTGIVAAVPAAPVACVADAAAGNNKALESDIVKLRDENGRLKQELQAQGQKIAALESAPKTVASSGPVPADVAALEKRTGDAESRVAGLQEQIARLRTENDAMKAASATAASTTVSTTANAAEQQKTNMATLAKLKSVEEQLGIVKAERDRLSGQINSLKNADAEGRVKVSSDNWNLEQATRRFNEAELEIRRLGSTLEQERAKCAVEKKDLEYMLFDPKIADKQQIAKLVTLEEQLAQAKATIDNQGQGDKAKIAEYQASIKTMEDKLALANTEATTLRRTLAEEQRTKLAVAEQGGVVDALKQEIASLNGQIRNMQGEKTAMAAQMSQIAPAAGGNAATTRVAARPNTVSSPVEVDRVDYDSVTTGNPVPVTAEAIAAPVPVPAMAAAAAPSLLKMMQATEVETMLRQAGVDVPGGVQSSGTAGQGRVAYRWQSNGLLGTAEQKPVQSSGQFDTYVTEYLNRTKTRCTGQFAAIPALEEGNGANRLSAYEIACVDQSGTGASAAVLFESRNGVFTTIAHEASPESMDLAMDARDKLIAAFQATRTASR